MQYRVPISRRTCDGKASDHAARTRLVFDNDGLPPFPAEDIAQLAGGNVGGAPSGEGNDNSDHLGRERVGMSSTAEGNGPWQNQNAPNDGHFEIADHFDLIL